MPNRRALLTSIAALAVPWPARATARADLQLAASWGAADGYRLGVLRFSAGRVGVRAALPLPTRAHGLLAERGGTVLAVARRPGDWLLRWDPADAGGRHLQRHWIEPDRAFNGHVLASADGRRLYTTETDLGTGAGLVGVRDAASLGKQDEWPTDGLDPHELAWDAGGHLVVANGGIETRPETGRVKHRLDRMDSSLVRLDAQSGRRLGQWRLDDRRLSLRHLAVAGDRIAIALQAQHDDEAERAQAPVLALFDGRSLEAAAPERALAGYGGDVAAFDGAFTVSCPRANGIAAWNTAGRWRGFMPLHQACPLAATAAGIVAGGHNEVLRGTAHWPLPALRLDNHWVLLSGHQPTGSAAASAPAPR